MEKVDLLEQLEGLSVLEERLPILGTLRETPRAGKSTRIKKYGLHLPYRSVFDHIVSLLAQAPFLQSLSAVKVPMDQLVSLFIFHDLSEALIGDIPRFTSFEISQIRYMTDEEKEIAEQKANALLLNDMPIALKKHFEPYLDILQAKRSQLYTYFYMHDRMDPMIAIWRYIYLFHEKLDIEAYLEAMTDFFLYPETQRACVEERVLSLARVLQSKECARRYYAEGDDFIETTFDQEIADPFKALLKRPMHFTGHFRP